VAHTGGKHPAAKPRPGFGGSDVLEVVDSDDGDAHRVLDTLTMPEAVSVPHPFQKTSKRGVATRRAMDVIRQRPKWAEESHARGVSER
jgi:phage-related protein